MTDSLLARCRALMGDGDVARALRVVTAARQHVQIEPSDPIAAAAAALLAGGDVDSIADLGDQLRDQHDRYVTHTRHLDGLVAVARALQDEARTRQRNGADRALGVLRDELADVLEHAAAVTSDLDVADSADEAIAAGVADQWGQARRLAAGYQEIRHVQAVVIAGTFEQRDAEAHHPRATLRTALPSTHRLVLTHGTVRDFATRYPGGYIAPDEPIGGGSITQVDTRDAPQPTALPWATGDGVTDLKWLVKNSHVVWLPTIAELRAMVQAADADAAAAAEQRESDAIAGIFERGRAAQEAMSR